MESNNSEIVETFRDGTVLVTGSTGFLGKILTEKLLRSCQIKTIVLIVRSKRNFTAKRRVTDVFKKPLFDRLRREKPDFENRIKIIVGCLENPSLGLTESDRDWIIEHVNFVFHCAATVKFNEPLEIATKINIRGTQHLLMLAAEMKNLKGFVYVSTAYSHCPRNEIKEQYYPVPITAKEIAIPDLDNMSTEVMENWPNSYTYTKAIAENLIAIKGNHLPISIFRPSIVGCTKSEPLPGWVDNLNAPTGITAAIFTGVLRTAPIATDKITDIIPVDYTINALICVMWDTVNRYKDSDKFKSNKKPKIFNYVSGVENPLTMGRYSNEVFDCYREAPPLKSFWYIFCIYTVNFWAIKILRFFLHRIPAAFVDLYLILSGKKPKMLKLYRKIELMIDLQHVFLSNEWTFHNDNTRELWSLLSLEDRQTFWFSFEEFNWKQYFDVYIKFGIRKCILGEDQSNIKAALTKNRRLLWLHRLCIIVFMFIVYQILCSLITLSYETILYYRNEDTTN